MRFIIIIIIVVVIIAVVLIILSFLQSIGFMALPTNGSTKVAEVVISPAAAVPSTGHLPSPPLPLHLLDKVVGFLIGRMRGLSFM